MSVSINEQAMIPIEEGQAVGRGWLAPTNGMPMGVTWHWTAGWTLESCRQTLGGAHAARKGEASAHYGVGRSFQEGIDRYVSLEDRSWHAGLNQTLRWDGRPSSEDFKGSRATIGVESVHIGHARDGIAAGDDWIQAASPNSRHVMTIQPWTQEQIVMLIQVGQEIVARWPHIGVRDHHGHHDVCPGFKEDVAGFPFAQVLRAIYRDDTIPDVWGRLWLPLARQRVLRALGFDLGSSGPHGDGVDGQWGRLSEAALAAFQRQQGLVEDANWTTFVCWAVHDVLAGKGIALHDILDD